MEQCDKCVAEPAVDQDDIVEPLPTPPPGCKTSDDHERGFTELADALETRGLEMLESDGRIDVATAKELCIASIRARHEAAQFTLRRENEHLVRAREKRIMDRSRGHH
jgi:hypothetical protein